MENIPDNVLVRIIYESDNINFNFFALKVMISRLKLKLSLDHNENTKQECINDLRDLFHKSKNIPNAKKDIQLLIEKYGING